MPPMTPDREPATSQFPDMETYRGGRVPVYPDMSPCRGEAAWQVSEFSAQIPAGRWSSGPQPPLAPGGQPDPMPVIASPVVPSPAVAAQALCAHFLANADRGDNAANDEFIAELVRRVRSRQAAAEASE